jgi:hypothetical protein
MQIDTDCWRRLLDGYQDAPDEGPDFAALQASAAPKQHAQAALDRCKAASVTGPVSPPLAIPMGAEILTGVGSHDQASLQRAYDYGLRQLEARVAHAEREHTRLKDRMGRASNRPAGLGQLVNSARRSAAGDKHERQDDALIRQLRVAAGPVAHALMEVPCQQPPRPALQPQRRT